MTEQMGLSNKQGIPASDLILSVAPWHTHTCTQAISAALKWSSTCVVSLQKTRQYKDLVAVSLQPSVYIKYMSREISDSKSCRSSDVIQSDAFINISLVCNIRVVHLYGCFTVCFSTALMHVLYALSPQASLSTTLLRPRCTSTASSSEADSRCCNYLTPVVAWLYPFVCLMCGRCLCQMYENSPAISRHEIELVLKHASVG